MNKKVNEDLTRVCAWCKKVMGTTPGEATGETHGMCDDCLSKFKADLESRKETVQ